MLNVKKTLNKIISRISEHETNMLEYKQLGFGEVNTTASLNESIDNFVFVVMQVYNINSSAGEIMGIIPVSELKKYTTTLHSWGINGYNGGRVYGYLHYVDSTHLGVQVSTGRGVAIFGLIRKLGGGTQ